MSIPSDLQDLIIDMNFYSSAGKGQKICFTTRTTIDSCGIVSYLKRRWYSENCARLVDETVDLIDRIDKAVSRPEWSNHIYLIYAGIPDLKRAITHQIANYPGYIDVISRLKLSSDNLNIIMSGISEEDRLKMENYKSLNAISHSSSSPSIKYGIDISTDINKCTCPIAHTNSSGFYTSSPSIPIGNKE